MDTFLQLTLSGIMVGAVYALVAMGFVVIYKASGIFNLCLGEMLLLGAGICWMLLVPLELPAWLAIILTFVFGIFMGSILERLAIRPMIGQPVFAAIMMTIALSLFLQGASLLGWSGEIYIYPELFPDEAMQFGGVAISQQLVSIFIFALLAVAAFSFFFMFTKGGLAMRAVAEDHRVAQSTGISVKRIFSLSWILAALVAVLGGILLGSVNGVSIALSTIGLTALPVVLLGGLDSIFGAIIAGFLVGVLQNLATGYLNPLIADAGITGGGTQVVFPYVIMMIVLFIRPYGLFGMKRIERI